ncbi:MAG: PaaI family thioesterase [Actinomycetes bacterium]
MNDESVENNTFSPEAVEKMFQGFHERAIGKSPEETARDQLAVAARNMSDAMMKLSASVDVVNNLTSMVNEVEQLMREHPFAGKTGTSLAPRADGSYGVGNSFLDRSPIIGSMNPIAPPMTIEIHQPTAGDHSTARVVGRVSFADVFEGPPGCVHGGFIAAAFDEVLGLTQSLTGNPGMTGQLTVRYSSPTPLNSELVCEGRIDRIEGRKIFTVATLMNGETKCAEAEGLFISMRPEVFERLLRIRRGELSE